jgi:hypothetical protein
VTKQLEFNKSKFEKDLWIEEHFGIKPDTGFLTDNQRTLFQLKKGIKRMAFIINRDTELVIVSCPEYKDEVHYDNEVMPMSRGRIVWSLLVSEGWTRSR